MFARRMKDTTEGQNGVRKRIISKEFEKSLWRSSLISYAQQILLQAALSPSDKEEVCDEWERRR